LKQNNVIKRPRINNINEKETANKQKLWRYGNVDCVIKKKDQKLFNPPRATLLQSNLSKPKYQFHEKYCENRTFPKSLK
jgi:hypothetical protein